MTGSDEATETGSRNHPVGWIAALTLTKAADAAVTLDGLARGAVEQNPVAVAAMDAVGPVVGLLSLSVFTVATTVGVVEWAARRVTDRATEAFRLAAYGPLVVVWLVAVSHNLLVVAAGTR